MFKSSPKQVVIAAAILFSIAGRSQQQKDLELSKPLAAIPAFKVGEKLQYRIHYGLIDAGTAKLEVKESDYLINNRKVLHLVGSGESNSFFDHIFKVRDSYETFVDAEAFYPVLFIRKVEEGSYRKKQNYTFHQRHRKVVTNKGDTFSVPPAVQDIVSSFYKARLRDYKALKIGDTITVNAFFDDKLWPASMRYVGTDTVKISTGKYSCLRFIPVVQKGRIFKNESDLTVWFSNDDNKIPIMAKAKILVGSITMELESCDGLANPLAKLQ